VFQGLPAHLAHSARALDRMGFSPAAHCFAVLLRFREKLGQKCHNRRVRDEQHRVTNLREALKST
jgi:hypothetical protein